MTKEHHETPGISDEIATEGHDLIHNAELQYRKDHVKDSMIPPDEGEDEPSQSATLGGAPGQGDNKSTLDKAKEMLKK